MESILPIWQPVGYSTYQITNAIARLYGQKATHTGVLDPLAEGVIVVLVGDERFNKFKYSEWHKTYEFTIAFGIATDSYDGMGLATNTQIEQDQLSASQMAKVLSEFVGKYEQHVPLYSAQKVNGKKLFEYPKHNLLVENLPVKKGEIFNIELLALDYTSVAKLIDSVCAKLQLIDSGEFRQKAILSAWRVYIDNLDQNSKHVQIPLAKIQVEISKGMYVRSLSQDIAHRLKRIGFVSELVRTHNGVYSKANSLTLEEVFKDRFEKKLFVSKYKS